MSLAFQQDYPLQGLNSFGFSAVAERFIVLETLEQVRALHEELQRRPQPLLWLGGGSNLVLAPRVEGIVAHIGLRGREIEPLEGSDRVRVTLAAGENWARQRGMAARRGDLWAGKSGPDSGLGGGCTGPEHRRLRG